MLPSGAQPATLKYRGAANANPSACAVSINTRSTIFFDATYGLIGSCGRSSVIGILAGMP